jgi:hypothetical protein
VTSQLSCGFEGCDQPVAHQLRFELAEPADAAAIVGTFVLGVCEAHFRPEFVVDVVSNT